MRAGIVNRPENYRWCSLGYHVPAGNKGNFPSVDFGLKEFAAKSEKDRFNYYRRFVHDKGCLNGLEKDKVKGFEINELDRFLYRTRYFPDSGLIGAKAFVVITKGSVIIFPASMKSGRLTSRAWWVFIR